MNSIVTIRLNDRESYQLERLKEITGQKANSKAIMESVDIAVTRYPEITEERDRLIQEVCHLKGHLESLVQAIQRAKQANDNRDHLISNITDFLS